VQFPVEETINFFEISQKLHNFTPFTRVALMHPIILIQMFVTYHVPVAQTHLLLDGSI